MSRIYAILKYHHFYYARTVEIARIKIQLRKNPDSLPDTIIHDVVYIIIMHQDNV